MSQINHENHRLAKWFHHVLCASSELCTGAKSAIYDCLVGREERHLACKKQAPAILKSSLLDTASMGLTLPIGMR